MRVRDGTVSKCEDVVSVGDVEGEVRGYVT